MPPLWQIQNLWLMFISSSLGFIILYCLSIKAHDTARISDNSLANKLVTGQIQDLGT